MFASVALLLFGPGRAVNHFASMLPVPRDVEHPTSVGVNAAFGLYAIGLVPGLPSCGGLADRGWGRPAVSTGTA